MKKTLLIMLLTMPFLSFSQKAVIKSDKHLLNNQQQDCYAVFIPGIEADFVAKEWKRYVKDKFDSKVSDKKEIVASESKIKELSPVNLLSVYTAIEKKDNGVMLYIGVDLGGAFLSASKHKDQYDLFLKRVEEFAKDCQMKALEQMIDAENKKLSNLNKEQEQLVKEKEKQLSNIEGWKKDIEEAEKKIKDNENNQSQKKKEIESQQKVVETWVNKKKEVN